MGKYKTTPIGKFLADYLVAWGVLRRNELGAANARLGTVDVSQNAWQLFQTGQVGRKGVGTPSVKHADLGSNS